jgi:AcrR family transcriptional regulator
MAVVDTILERRRQGLRALQRQQITDGFAIAATEKGYAGVTIAEIVRLAHVSKTTFYDHFADKEALYVHLHGTVLAALEAAMNASLERTVDEPDWTARVRDLVRTRLEVPASDPTLLAQAVIEPQVPTAAAQQIRMDAARRNSRLWISLSEQVAAVDSAVSVIPDYVALAGMAVNVQFINRVAADGPDPVRALKDPLTDIWLRLFRGSA